MVSRKTGEHWTTGTDGERVRGQGVAAVELLLRDGLPHYLNVHAARSQEEGKASSRFGGTRQPLRFAQPSTLELWLSDYKSRQAPRRGASSTGVPSRAGERWSPVSSCRLAGRGGADGARASPLVESCVTRALCPSPRRLRPARPSPGGLAHLLAPRPRLRTAGPCGASCGRLRRRARRRQSDAR